jgi:hypothetical protein
MSVRRDAEYARKLADDLREATGRGDIQYDRDEPNQVTLPGGYVLNLVSNSRTGFLDCVVSGNDMGLRVIFKDLKDRGAYSLEGEKKSRVIGSLSPANELGNHLVRVGFKRTAFYSGPSRDVRETLEETKYREVRQRVAIPIVRAIIERGLSDSRE